MADLQFDFDIMSYKRERNTSDDAMTQNKLSNKYE